MVPDSDPQTRPPGTRLGVRSGARPRQRPEPAPLALPHLPGIDGLRAVAVAAVLIYHAGIEWLPGGFLGVEVFFVISGFLISGLLLAEWSTDGRISLPRFWYRRARRLLPALFVVLLATLAFAVVWLPDEVTRLRADAAAAAAYVSNWYLIAGEQSYFETAGRQSPLLHLWSLAVEEQFYVLWPVVVAVGLRLVGRSGMVVLTAAGAAASAAWMAALHDPATDPSRVYYGTDTRLTGLLLGAVLAFAWGRQAGATAVGRSRRVADLAALGGALGLALTFATLDGGNPLLYPVGFVVVGGSTVALVVGAAHPVGLATRHLLGRAPMQWLGTRSYGIYLWHWPVFSVTRPGLDVAVDGPALLAARLLATAGLAELSFRLVERPIRSGAAGRAWTRWREAWRASPGHPDLVRMPAALLTLGAMAALSVLLVTVAAASPPERPAWLATDRVQGVVVGGPTPGGGPDRGPVGPGAAGGSQGAALAASGGPSTSPASPPPDVTPPPEAAAPSTTLAPESPRAADASPGAGDQARPPPSGTPRRLTGILALGDSVLVDAAPALADALGRLEVDAEIGRQVDDGVAILERRRRAGTLPDVVILNLGTNGPLYKAQFERAMAALRDVPVVVWVTVSVPRPWEDQTNGIITKFGPRYPNVRIVDWHAVSADRPNLFWDDGYHPTPEGAKVYAELVADAIP